MAKLFANKFNLDQLPDPKKPKQDIPQGGTNIQKPSDDSLITDPNTDPTDIKSSNEILEQQGVRKSVANQYVSVTKTEPFGTLPVNQGSTEVVKPKDVQEKVSNVNPKKEYLERDVNQVDSKITNPNIKPELVDQGSKVTNPNIEIEKVDQGSQITNPNIQPNEVKPGDRITDPKTQINPIEAGSRTTNPETEIKKVVAGDRITNPNIQIKEVKEGDRITNPETTIQRVSENEFITNPNTVINKVTQGEFITNPNIQVNPIKAGDRITDPNTLIKKVDQNEFIVDPQIEIKKVKQDEFITNPNIQINKVEDNEFIVNPNIKINPVQADEKIVNPKIQPSKVKADEMIVNPDTVIKKVETGDRIVNPNTTLSQQKTIDIINSIPNNAKGIGATRFWPRTISLKNRLNQPFLGTTRHLPEYILSDQNTGQLDITDPRVVKIQSDIKVQKVRYGSFILNQGVELDVIKGFESVVKPVEFGKEDVNQGSITIKNLQRELEKVSPVNIEKVKVGERTIDPLTRIIPVVPGERTFNPDVKITKVVPDEQIVNPNTKVVQIKPGDRIIDPQIVINEIKPGDRIVDPDIKVKKIEPGDRIVDPQIVINEVKPGDRITDPKTKVLRIKPGDRIVDPKVEIPLVKPGERTINPNTVIPRVRIGARTTDPRTVIPLVKPGARTVDPKTKIIPIRPGSRTIIPSIYIQRFEESDDKADYATEPFSLTGTGPFPSDARNGRIPLDGKIIVLPGSYLNPTGADYLTPVHLSTHVFPSANSAGQIGFNYVNTYSVGSKFNYTNSDTPLKDSVNGGVDPPFINEPGTNIPKPVAFPAAAFGDHTLEGGYRALNYSQIRARRAANNRRELDFTYEDNPPNTLQPWRTRLGMPSTGADTIYSGNARDFVTMKFGGIQFRSYLKSLSDSFSAQYNDANYIGRPDTLKIFKGTTRQIGVSFLVPVLSESELSGVYSKLKQLIAVTSVGEGGGGYLKGPKVSVTIGNWIVGAPCIVNSLKFDLNPTEYSWDIIHEVPQVVDVSMDISALGDNAGNTFLKGGSYISYP